VMADHSLVGELPANSTEEEIMLMATGHTKNAVSLVTPMTGKE